MNRKLYAKEVLKEAVRVLGIVAAVGGGILDALDRVDRLSKPREIGGGTRTYDDQYNHLNKHYDDCNRAFYDLKEGQSG